MGLHTQDMLELTITNLQIVLNNPKNTCQNFPTPKNPKIENFKVGACMKKGKKGEGRKDSLFLLSLAPAPLLFPFSQQMHQKSSPVQTMA